MPLRNFVIHAPDVPEKVNPDDAPALFDEHGIMPHEAVQAMVDAARVEHAEHTLLSPSKLTPETTCPRQILIEHFLPYDCNPFALWDAMEGTLWHSVFSRAGSKINGWHRELSLPREEDGDRPELDGKLAEEEGVLALEVLPGLLMRGTIDRLREDFLVLVDHKTNRYPWTNKPDSEPIDFAEPWKGRLGNLYEWQPQLNIYRFMVEDVFGTAPEELWVWRTYRGSRRMDKTFRKMPVGLLTREQTLARVGEFAYGLRDLLRKAQEIRNTAEAAGVDPTPELEALVKATPMTGYLTQMFGGTKCSKYCEVKDTCFNLAGMPTF